MGEQWLQMTGALSAYLSQFHYRDAKKELHHATVICIPGAPMARNCMENAGLKCQELTSDECRGFNFPPIHGHVYSN